MKFSDHHVQKYSTPMYWNLSSWRKDSMLQKYILISRSSIKQMPNSTVLLSKNTGSLLSILQPFIFMCCV